MKVTYTQNRFEIDGVPVINPELLGNVCIDSLTDLWVISLPDFTHRDLQNGDSFDLPENIITEMWHNDKTGKPIYRLKLKEPLVDTGSKELIPLEKVFELLVMFKSFENEDKEVKEEFPKLYRLRMLEVHHWYQTKGVEITRK